MDLTDRFWLQFIEYQQVVSDDLRQKKIISDKIEQDELENRTATMVIESFHVFSLYWDFY